MNIVDRLFNGFVEFLVVFVPAIGKRLWIRIADFRLGWHVLAALSSIVHSIAGVLVHIRSEEDMDIFIEDTGEVIEEDLLGAIRGKIVAWIEHLDGYGFQLFFLTDLFLLLLAGGICVQTGSRVCAALAAFSGLSWLASALDAQYAPISMRVHQTYIVSRILCAFSFLPLLLLYYRGYRMHATVNILLQGIMLSAFVVYLLLYLLFVALNGRQSLYLRLLSGVLGILPVLMLSAAVAYAFVHMGSGFMMILSGILTILGAAFLFISDRIESLVSLGAVRFRYRYFRYWIFHTTGFLFLLLSSFIS